MKKILFFAFIAVSLIFAGCGGNNGGGYNPPSTTGNIQFQNQTDDAYYVEVAGYETFTLGGNRTVTYSGYEAGRHYITVTQKKWIYFISYCKRRLCNCSCRRDNNILLELVKRIL